MDVPKIVGRIDAANLDDADRAIGFLQNGRVGPFFLEQLRELAAEDVFSDPEVIGLIEPAFQESQVDFGREKIVLHLKRLTIQAADSTDKRDGLSCGPKEPGLLPRRSGQPACQLGGKCCAIRCGVVDLPAEQRSVNFRQPNRYVVAGQMPRRKKSCDGASTRTLKSGV